MPVRHTLYTMLLLALLTAVPNAWAQCIVVPPDPPRRPHPAQVILETVDVDVEVVDGVATTRLRETVRNPGHFELQARFVLPIPRGAVVRGASLKVGDRWIEAEVLEAGAARRAYEDIVRRAIDPALIEYVDDGLLRTHVFPIPAGATREIELTLTTALPEEFGRWHLRLPLRALDREATRVAIRGLVRSQRRLAEPYSPTHTLRTERRGDREWTFEGEVVASGRDLQLLLPVEGRELTAIVASTRTGRDEGTLMLRLSPGHDRDHATRLARDLVLVLDTSGSMAGEKIRQAKAALKVCLESLGPDDRFGLITYEADIRSLTNGLARASERDEILRAIDRIEARGGTNIGAALDAALAMLEEDDARPAYVVLLSDGLPTVGERDTEGLRSLAREGNARAARLFTFGVGADVDARLLDALATDHRAASRYVLPGEDLELALGDFALQIAEPVWSDLELRWEGARVSQPVPARLPDLFRGQTLSLQARYDRGGRVTLVVRGRRHGDAVERRFRFELADSPSEHGYLPALWAGRRVAWLERELRVRPDDEELREEIRRLGERYALVTSQTSLLMREPEFAVADPLGRRQRRDGLVLPGAPRAQALKSRTEELKVAARQSRALEAVAMDAVEDAARLGVVGKDRAGSAGGAASIGDARVDGRIFLTHPDGRWVQSGLESREPDLVIRAFSDAWFELIRVRPDLRTVLAASTELVLEVGNHVLKVEPEAGIETFERGLPAWLRAAG